MLNSEDPYFLVHGEVQASLSQLTTQFQSWARMVKSGGNLTSLEVKTSAKELQFGISHLNASLDDLEGSIYMAESNPAQFNLSQGELTSRRLFVTKARAIISEVEGSINDPSSISSSSNGKTNPYIIEMDKLSSESENETSGNGISAQNQMIIEEQDVQLDHMLGSIRNLKDIAGTVNQELDLHAELLDDIDETMDRTQDKLSNAMKKVKAISSQVSGICSGYLTYILIVILSLLAIILFFG